MKDYYLEHGAEGREGRRLTAAVLTACVLVGIGVVAFWPGEREPEERDF